MDHGADRVMRSISNSRGKPSVLAGVSSTDMMLKIQVDEVI